MNQKYTFESLEVPIYFFVENNKVVIDVEGMENEFDMKVNELVKKFDKD